MAWWIEAKEIQPDSGQPTGRFRLTATSDEDGGGPHALCDCTQGHSTAKEARDCPYAVEKSEMYG